MASGWAYTAPVDTWGNVQMYIMGLSHIIMNYGVVFNNILIRLNWV